MDHADYLERQLPHRLDALAIAALMIEYRLLWGAPKPMQVFVEGKLQFEGRTSMFMNPILEVGVLHARALLEFIGLKVSAGELVQLTPSARNRDDAAIERLSGPTGPLPLVTPEDVEILNPSDPRAARHALVALILAAHKGLAHTSATYFSRPADAEQIRLALLLTQRLVEVHVYAPLGRARPPLPIEARRRGDA